MAALITCELLAGVVMAAPQVAVSAGTSSVGSQRTKGAAMAWMNCESGDQLLRGKGRVNLFHSSNSSAASERKHASSTTRRSLSRLYVIYGEGDEPLAGDEEPQAEEAAIEGDGGIAVALEVTPPSSISQLKSGLVDSLYATDRGLRASSDTRAEVLELINQLEAINPTPSPTDALPLLNGKWILAFTSSPELFPLLAAGNLPLIKVGDISQTIDSSEMTVENLVTFSSPVATTSFGASASFEVRSPKRVQIKFEEGVIGTPQLTDFIELPSEVTILGQKVDLNPIQNAIRPLQEAAQNVVRTLAERPPLKFNIQGGAQSWLLTTYLDEDLRITRGDGNSVFVLLKEGSPLLDQL